MLRPVLLYLEPGILKSLEWNVEDRPIIEKSKILEIFDTEHWKNLESFKFIGGAKFPQEEAGIQILAHLKEFEVLVNNISVLLLFEIRENLLRSAHLESAVFRASGDKDFYDFQIPEIFRDFLNSWKIGCQKEGEAGNRYECLRIEKIDN